KTPSLKPLKTTRSGAANLLAGSQGPESRCPPSGDEASAGRDVSRTGKASSHANASERSATPAAAENRAVDEISKPHPTATIPHRLRSARSYARDLGDRDQSGDHPILCCHSAAMAPAAEKERCLLSWSNEARPRFHPGGHHASAR